MKATIKPATLLFVLFALAGCITRGEIEEIKKGQEDILAKLDKIEKAGANRPAPPAPPPQRGPDASKVYAFPVGDSATHGPNDAWVTIVEVSDFQCPFCGRAIGTIKEIEQKYGNDVRVVFKHNPLPFHARALPAAVASECAREQNKFWPLHDKLFENQRALEDANIESYAKEVGLDLNKFKKCQADAKIKKRIEDDQAVAARLGARGTPAFFINGRFLSGAQPFPNFQVIIDEELKKAKDSGISKKDYYSKAVEQKGEKAI